MRTLAKVLVVFALTACGEERESPAAQPEPAPVPEAPSESVPTAEAEVGSPSVTPDSEPTFEPSRPDSLGVLGFINELHLGPSAAEWIADHRDWSATVSPDAYGGVNGVGDASGWCLRIDVPEQETPAGLAVTRRFFFYPAGAPEPPEDLSFPTMNDNPTYFLQSCHLGLVTAEVMGLEAADGRHPLTDRYEEELGPTVDTRMQELGGLLDDVSGWMVDTIRIGVGTTAEDENPVSYAYSPLMTGRWFDRIRTFDREWETEVFNLALDAAAMPVQARELIDSVRSDYGFGYGAGALPAALELLRAAQLPPTRPDPATALADTTSARYGVLDHIFEDLQGEQPFHPEYDRYTPWPEWIDGLAAEGVVYRHRSLVTYEGSLADSARALTGPGNWADILSLGRARSFCNGLWARRYYDPMLDDIHDPRFRPRLHFLIAETYAAMVELYRRDQGNWVENAYGNFNMGEPLGEAAELREAIVHYAEAARTELDPAHRAMAWRKAFAAANGLPISAWFDCEAY